GGQIHRSQGAPGRRRAGYAQGRSDQLPAHAVRGAGLAGELGVRMLARLVDPLQALALDELHYERQPVGVGAQELPLRLEGHAAPVRAAGVAGPEDGAPGAGGRVDALRAVAFDEVRAAAPVPEREAPGVV